MKIGVYQFSSTCDVNDNLKVIEKAIEVAAEKGVRLLVFHECALCGYPPIETEIEKIIREEIEVALSKISIYSNRYSMYVAVGTVRFDGKNRFNSIVVFDDNGKILGCYDKKALWGWDEDNFTRGANSGIFKIDDIKVGFRICFDIRFPELFRELYKQSTDICFVSFSDTSKEPSPVRYNIIKAHLITRAVENVMPVVSVNSITNFQTAPTAVFDCNGCCVKEAERNVESLLLYDFIKPQMSFGMEGRLVNIDRFL